MSLSEVKKELRKKANPEKAKFLKRFFKTGPGEYAEGDRFLGVTVPHTRQVVKKFRTLDFNSVDNLLRSTLHEERLLALLIWVEQYGRGETATRQRIYNQYLKQTRYINNWDLVDTSAPQIVGAHLEKRNKAPLRTLARSKDLWERRIAIMATFHFIRLGVFSHTLSISRTLLKDEHDLIHKAVGWMLREVGNRNRGEEEQFLKKHYKNMPRTMLRYAIERFPEPRRKAYLLGKIN